MKKPRPAALPSVTVQMPTRCGKIYVTLTVDSGGLPFETFVMFGKAGHCGAAIFDATTKLMSYRSGMDPHEAVKALGGIGCHCGTDSCMNAVSLVLREFLEDPIPAHLCRSLTSRLKGEGSRLPRPKPWAETTARCCGRAGE